MKTSFFALGIVAIFVGGIFLLSNNGSGTAGTGTGASANNVSIVGNQQIVEITAKGGYLPRMSVAKAGIPTIIRFNTTGTFDCSSAVRIPSMGISRNLPQSGVTDIDIGTRQVSTLKGSCSMGMYPFEVVFN